MLLVVGMIFFLFGLLPLIFAGPVDFISGSICVGLMFIGISAIGSDLKKIIINMRTTKNGEECFAILKKISTTGVSLNEKPELKGEFSVYVVSMGQLIDIEEIIGFDVTKYRMGDYIKVKYLDGDIHIIEKVNSDVIPENVKNLLEYIKQDINEDIIVIDGHKYKRVD